jgi:hypothetical protein
MCVSEYHTLEYGIGIMQSVAQCIEVPGITHACVHQHSARAGDEPGAIALSGHRPGIHRGEHQRSHVGRIAQHFR